MKTRSLVVVGVLLFVGVLMLMLGRTWEWFESSTPSSGGTTVPAQTNVTGPGSTAGVTVSAPAMALLERSVLHVRTTLGVDRRPLPPEASTVETVAFRREVPAVFMAFADWMNRYGQARLDARAALLDEGKGLLEARRAAWPELAHRDPEAALWLSPSSAQRALLPAEWSSRLERVVAAEGFYGVRATCNHGAELGDGHSADCRIDHDVILGDEVFAASIYGARGRRLTEENASLYGVALDGLIALHEDDVVVQPAVSGAGFDVFYRGRTMSVADATALSLQLKTLATP